MPKRAPAPPVVVLTVGHSTRPLETFLELLKAHDVRRLVDVRTVPCSRHNPQFNKESLPESLAAVGIKYVHLPGLGGLRHPRRDSPNTGWRNTGFRGFADYMQTPEFEKNLEELLDLARRQRLAIMCAEAVPWRCHRSLIANALAVRGIQVEHIASATRRNQHALTPWARVEGLRITYPPESLPLGFESNKWEAL
ncbi:MAG: DUF488 domain-containing protein [Terriglobia bacterium]|jgi:uncharacterized protein (DUF488 family)